MKTGALSMTDFEILEHTADIGVRASGEALPELFATTAMGVQSVALEPERIEPRNAYRLAASGEDVPALLVNWLNELIYHLDAQRIAFARFDFRTFTDTEVVADGWGEPRDLERHRPRLVVKAATYHQLKIAREDGRWVAEVFLDI